MISSYSKKQENKLTFICKSCGCKYDVEIKDVVSMPLWKFESCSNSCAKKFSRNKLLMLSKSKKKKTSFDKTRKNHSSI